MRKWNNRGMTLIEIILSVAILGIVVMAALSLFSSGMLFEFSAGNKSEAVFQAQQNTDNAISTGASADSEKLSFSIPGGKFLYVSGNWTPTTVTTANGKTSETDAFLPIRGESEVSGDVLVTISFDSAGGSAVTGISQAEGTAVVPPADPTRAGYSFTGWSPELPTTMPSSDLTVTAQWEVSASLSSILAGYTFVVNNPTAAIPTITITPPADLDGATVTIVGSSGGSGANYAAVTISGLTGTVTRPTGGSGAKSRTITLTASRAGESNAVRTITVSIPKNGAVTLS